MKRNTVPLMMITLLVALSTVAATDLRAEPLRLLAWEASTECRCTADLSEELPRGLEEAAEFLGIESELETIPREELRSRLTAMHFEGDLPDLVWVPEHRIGDLASAGFLFPLNEIVGDRPWLLEGLDDESLSGFTFGRQLFALPLDREGELSGIGQAITVAAMERGRADLAMELAGFLKDRLPPRPVPDLMASLTRIVDDECTISVDTSGEPLHRRGWRKQTGKAPLREDLARALLCSGGWTADDALVDPMMGSGTIVIEAATMAMRSAPGRLRSFALERMELDTTDLLGEAREQAEAGRRARVPRPIVGRDHMDGALRAALGNAERAGGHGCHRPEAG